MALFALLCAVAAAAAHTGDRAEYRVVTWGVEQGLPESSATAMVQTRDGYLWFGTFNGLVRFNGTDFEVFDPHNTPQLPSAGIVNLHLDRLGRLWVSTTRGLVVRVGDAWHPLGAAEGWQGDFVRSIAERSDGEVLITTFDGYVLESSGLRLRALPPPIGRGPSCIAAVDSSGRWWISRPGFLGFWSDGGWTLAVPEHRKVSDIVCGASRDGGIWELAGRELRKYHDGAEVGMLTLPENPGGVWNLYEDTHGNVWVATYDRGLCRIGPDGSMVRWDSTRGLAYDSVRFVFEDREGTLWVGTSGGGLSRFTRQRVRTCGIESGLEEPIVKSLAARSSGDLLAATYGKGLFVVDDCTATRFPLDIPCLTLQSVLVDRQDRLWVGTFGCGLYLSDAHGTRKVSELLTGGGNIIAIFEDSRGRIWAAGGQGIGVLEGEAWRPIGTAEGLPAGGVRGFSETPDGQVWLANDSGVYTIDGDLRLSEVRRTGGDSIRDVLSFHAERDGTLWMGTAKSGLLRWRNGHFAQIDARSGLCVSAIHAIAPDDFGYRWLASNRGLARVSVEELGAAADGSLDKIRCLLLDTDDGMASIEYTGGRQPVWARDRQNRLWFATVRGAVSVDPHRFTTNAVPPLVHIESLAYTSRADGRYAGHTHSTTRHLPPMADPMSLPAGSRRFELRYAAMSYVEPSKVRFEVMLQGLDADWQQAGANRSVIYHDLRPGRYTFRVRAANNDGLWDRQGTSLTLDVLPFFWETWWFQGLALATIIGGSMRTALWIGRRRQRERRQHEERFRLAIEAAPNTMILVDTTGRITMANNQAERDFGYLHHELIGAPIERLIPDNLKVPNADLREARTPVSLPGPKVESRDLTGRRKDGGMFPVEVALNQVRTSDGVSILVSIVNISARKRSEQEIAQQRSELNHLSRVNMLGELSGSLAHELNQPLTAILSNAQAALRLMSRENVDMGEVREILGDIVDQDKRAGDVIHRLRALLKKEEIEHQPLDLADVVRDVLRLMRSDLINHGVDVHLELPPDLNPVRGDRVQLQQVLLNLVINACDAMSDNLPGQRLIRVRAGTADDGGVWVSVSDTGSSIATEIMTRLFEPFVSSKAKGMGLGLAVCRTIIRSHQGEIWAENNTGAGATFYFSLPANNGEHDQTHRDDLSDR